MLGAIRTLNRLELMGETLRAALNAIAIAAAPDWLARMTPPDWHERYDRRVENIRLPEAATKREAYAAQVGADGFLLLEAVGGPGTPAELPAVAVLRRVWSRHFERATPDAGGKGSDSTPGARLRGLRASNPDGRVESPYDPDARFRSRSGRSWTGYMVHLTETCDADAPRLIVHADRPTPACTRPCGSHRSTRRWLPRTWLQPSTSPMQPTWALTSFSMRMNGMAST